MERCVTEEIEQAIEEFKDRYPLSSDMNLMFNTKQKDLEADMDAKRKIMMTTLEQKAQDLIASLIATKVAHEKISKTIKEEIENEAEEVCFGLRNKCNVTVLQVNQELEDQLTAIEDQRIFEFNQEATKANPQWTEEIQKTTNEKLNMVNLPLTVLRKINDSVQKHMKESKAFKGYLILITEEANRPNIEELAELILQSDNFKTTVQESATASEQDIMNTLLPLIENHLQEEGTHFELTEEDKKQIEDTMDVKLQ